MIVDSARCCGKSRNGRNRPAQNGAATAVNESATTSDSADDQELVSETPCCRTPTRMRGAAESSSVITAVVATPAILNVMGLAAGVRTDRSTDAERRRPVAVGPVGSTKTAPRRRSERSDENYTSSAYR